MSDENVAWRKAKAKLRVNGDGDRIAQLERQVEKLSGLVGTLISWMAQSAVSPLSMKEADELLRRLETK